MLYKVRMLNSIIKQFNSTHSYSVFLMSNWHSCFLLLCIKCYECSHGQTIFGIILITKVFLPWFVTCSVNKGLPAMVCYMFWQQRSSCHGLLHVLITKVFLPWFVICSDNKGIPFSLYIWIKANSVQTHKQVYMLV